jgi:DNA-binding Lrp family transcriptional regulator
MDVTAVPADRWKFSSSTSSESVQKLQGLAARLAEAAKVPPMDSKDYQIIAALQANGRMTNQELSEQVSLTPTPCLRRLRMLEESGMIRGYTAVVDEEAFGLPVTAFVGVKLKEHTAESVRRFERAIQKIDAVLDCYVMTGQVDYLLRVLAQSLKDYERFVRQELHAIPGIQSIDTSFAYSRVKRSVVFPDLSDPG